MQQEDGDISVQDVRNHVGSLVLFACADLETVAGKLNTSPRSLQRKLAEQGASFSEIVNSIRYERAKRLLGDTAISITDIGSELGYKDASNFCRAFARWSGVSPLRWRRQNSKDDDAKSKGRTSYKPSEF